MFCRAIIAESGFAEEIMKIEHVALYVNNLVEARNFFVKYLSGHADDGYHNSNTGFRSYFISFDDGSRLEIMSKPDMVDIEKELNRTGYAHVAFSVGSPEQVDKLTSRLKADGYEVVSGPRITGDGYYESCVVAVEGNQIEITV
jgi:lactoylglutathione lyase